MSQELELLKKVAGEVNEDVEFLNLGANYPRKLSEEGAAWILECTKWANLRNINLTYMEMRDVGIQYLARCNWPLLQKLHVEKNLLTSEGARFISLANWRNLTRINLSRNKIDEKGAEYISKADWPQLEVLDLSECGIGANGAMHLSNGKWPRLSNLYLNLNSIGNNGLGYLVTADWKELETLNLSYNKIDGKGAYWFTQANWPALKELILAKNFLGYYKGKTDSMGGFYLTQMNSKLSRLQIQINQLTMHSLVMILNSSLVDQDADVRFNYNHGFEQAKKLIKKGLSY